MKAGYRKKAAVLLLFLGAVAAAVAVAVGVAGQRRAAEKEPEEVTVYLDHTNQAYVRMMVALYDNLSQIAQYSGEEETYPLISWNLVDKSWLSAEDYREQLLAELEAGEGPDLVFLDEYSCENPAALMEQGYFAELDSWMDSGNCIYGASHFVTGTIEAGQAEGRQYLIPVSVDIPVLCSTREQLQRAGISADALTGDALTGTEELLTAAAAYFQETGRYPFASGSFLEKLELYAGEKENWSREMRNSVELLAAASKQDEGICGVAEEFVRGEILFLTKGIDDYRGMAAQLGFLPEDEEILFFPLLRTDGSMQAVVRQAVAVNKNSEKNPAAYAALNAFYQENIINYSANLPAATATGNLWSGLLDEAAGGFTVSKEQKPDSRELTGSESWQYRKVTKNLVETAVYPVFSLPEEREDEKKSSGKVLSVMLPDFGLREESLLYRWVEAAAKKLEEDTGIHVEMAFCSSEKLLLADRAADITVFCMYMPFYLRRSEFEAHVYDYRDLLEDSPLAELAWKEGILEEAEQAPVMGIPFTEDQTCLNSFVISAGTKFPEEAMQLISYCLTSELYEELLEKYGEESVLRS